MHSPHTLGKAERLKSRKQIEYLFTAGMRFNVPPFRVSYSISSAPGKGELLFGIGAGTRNFRKAVDRNRIKRLAREAWRLQNTGLKTCVREQSRSLYVFLVYTGRELPEYALVSEKMAVIITRLQSLMSKHVE